MAKRNNKNLTLILVGIGILIILFLLFFNGGSGTSITQNKKIISCDVTIRNSIGFSPNIQGEPSCSVTPVNALCFNIGNMGIISDQGNIVMDIGGKQKSIPYDINEGIFGSSDKTYTISLCVSESNSNGEIRLISNNQLIDSKEIIF